MKRYIDIPVTEHNYRDSRPRVWRLVVGKHDVRNEFIVEEHLLGQLIDSVTSQPGIIELRCEPYYGTAFQNVWMTSKPQRPVAA